MKIPDDLKKRLLNEFDFCIQKIQEEELVRKKLYYFSGTYGLIERIMRFHYEPQLLMVHAILNLCYSALIGVVESRERGDTAREMPPNLSETLVEYLTELRHALSENKDTYKILEKFIALGYRATGPGYYTTQLFEHMKARN